MRQRLVDRLSGSHHLGFVHSAEWNWRSSRTATHKCEPDREPVRDAHYAYRWLARTLRTNLNRKLGAGPRFETGHCFFRDGERYSQPLRIGGLRSGPHVSGAMGHLSETSIFDVKGDVEALVRR
jgi:hypothetical protein